MVSQMHPSTYEHIYSRREQIVSNFTAVPVFSRLLLRDSRRECRNDGHSHDVTFHFSRIQQGDSLPIAMTRHQRVLFNQLSLRPKQRVLALACGSGAASWQLVQFSNATVVGIDTDSRLVSRARISAEEAGLTGQLTYHHVRDICEALQSFPDSSFDAVFGIELGYRITSPKTFYKHVERVLKPSGRFAIYEWCFTDAMTLANADHVAAVQNLLCSFPKTTQGSSISTIADLVSTVRGTGFVNVTTSDLALRHNNIPWYRPLEDYENSRSHASVSLSWWYGQLSIAALLTAGRLGIFSPMVLVTCEKKGPSL